MRPKPTYKAEDDLHTRIALDTLHFPNRHAWRVILAKLADAGVYNGTGQAAQLVWEERRRLRWGLRQ